jgi:Raf kinase inhibitor-like YbhB/YbcL family protein
MMKHFPSWFGRWLQKRRAGAGKALFHHPDLASLPATLTLSSAALGPDAVMSPIHTDDGAGLSPQFSWRGVPPSAASLVLVVEDADSPTPGPFVHLIVWGLPGLDGGLDSGVLKSRGRAGAAFNLGRNGMGRCEYTPPDPPPGHGPHQYMFQLYALDKNIEFPAAPNRDKLHAAIRGHVLAKGMLTGIYERA